MRIIEIIEELNHLDEMTNRFEKGVEECDGTNAIVFGTGQTRSITKVLQLIRHSPPSETKWVIADHLDRASKKFWKGISKFREECQCNKKSL